MNQGDLTLLQHALQCINENELVKAKELLSDALKSSPDNSDIFRFLSVIAALEADYLHALELINQALSLAPENGVSHSNKGNILKELGRYEEALCSYDVAIRLAPSYAEAFNNKGNLLQDLHHYEDSLIWYDKAIALNPKYVEAYCNKGNALEWLRRSQEAMTNFDKATAIDPQHIDAYWQKAMNQLANGDYELGLQNYEARWSKSNPVVFQFPHIPRLETIENIAGKKVLVWAEQGLGDTIQFCRYVRFLSLKGAEVTFFVPNQLLAIFDQLRQFCTLKSNVESIELEFDLQTPLMSLPMIFGTTIDSIPSEIPYLVSDDAKKKILSTALKPSPALKVGVVWSGGARLMHSEGYPDFQRRNIGLEQISDLKEIKGIDFYSLQKGDPAESELRLRKAEIWPDIIDCASLLKDFSDTAALIDSLDLIISVDTSTAHLAGAMGKPIWILNRYDSCWRWLRGRTDSPWYPTATIYQQSQPGNWSDVIEAVKADLVLMEKEPIQNSRTRESMEFNFLDAKI